MFLKSATVATGTTLAVLLLPPTALASDGNHTVASAPDPVSGQIPGFTYGESKGNWYHTGGYFPTVWPYSVQQIGVGPNPAAGVPFYLHARTRVILDPNERVAATVQLTIDQDAGGLSLRYAPTASMPLRCSRTQFRLAQAPVEIPCPAISVENGQFTVSNPEPLNPDYSLDVEFPVVVNDPTTGTAAMTARWTTGDVTLSEENVHVTVPVTVAANPNPPSNPSLKTKPLPKKLRTAKKVHSTTPKTCSVKKNKVVFRKKGLCKLTGNKHGHTVKAKVRY